MNSRTSASSPVSEEWTSLQNGRASERSDNASEIHTVFRSSIDTSPKSRNSTTSTTCQLTLSGMPASNARPYCPEVFPASRSLVPGSKEARKTTAISGRKCLELCRSSGPLGSLEKTFLESSGWHSMIFLPSWSIAVTPQGRSYFRLRLSEPSTAAIDVSLLPTMTVSDAHGHQFTYDKGDKNRPRPSLAGAARLFPTPITPRPHDSDNTAGRYYPSQNQKDLTWMVNIFPTPTNSMMTIQDMEQAKFMGTDPKRPKYSEIWPTPHANCHTGPAKHGQGAPNIQTVMRERERESLANSDKQRSQGYGRLDHDRENACEWLTWQGRKPLEGIWIAEPDVGRVAHGIPRRVDRLRALGNAVVPEQVLPLFEAIACIERRNQKKSPRR